MALDPLVASNFRAELRNRLPLLLRRLQAVAEGRVTPSLDTMPINSGRRVNAAVIFFDIRNFTALNSSDAPEALKNTLLMLNCVIPMMMRVLYRHNAYIEKNTGDGLMAILGVEQRDVVACNRALTASEEMLAALHFIVNPVLVQNGLQPIDARIGIDYGRILISRIGLPSGTSPHQRNMLTAVGPAANRASKIQHFAGTNEIWVGNDAALEASNFHSSLTQVTPSSTEWAWQYGNGDRYHLWRLDTEIRDPFGTILAGARLQRRY